MFYWAYREWLSWLFLMAIVWLPWFSLLCSLPAILTCSLRAGCVPQTVAGTPVSVSLIGKCNLPMPHVKTDLLVENAMTGQLWRIKDGGTLPTDHCGRLRVTLHKTWCYDYLGLLRFPARKKRETRILVRPKPVKVTPVPDVSRYLANAFKPKSGGGFSENHELRLYRPGDNLKQVHWKLSAKTGKLVYRESMEALRGKAVLTMHLSGSQAELDDKLGRLFYLSTYLLERDIPHYVSCLTGSGLLSLSVGSEEDALAAQAVLLSSPVAQPGAEAVYMRGSWSCHVGGESDA